MSDVLFYHPDILNCKYLVSDDGDGDATNAKINSKTRQFATYDAPDEDDLKIIEQTDLALNNEDFDIKANENEIEVFEENMSDIADYPEHSFEKSTNKRTKSSRRDRIISKSTYVTNYLFDSVEAGWSDIELQLPFDNKRLLLLDIAESACKKAVIRDVGGITKCYPSSSETKGGALENMVTEGVNFSCIWLYDNILDINKIYSNDIAAILKTYGVEAARSTIIKEISNVFSAYGIHVDPRHLTLVADYMTFEGSFKPFSRIGIDSNPSPLLKMSFESTCNFLEQATLFGDVDMLNSPSARLALGKVVQGGTGSFEIRQPCETLNTR
ncbi:426_t:CDS:2 [Acaulospora morrowiae]|uniref:DNA-directed RNA polymerase n=1 Tax=Acaulospora morrowiae TaxID=94023 RepID=A0A9N9FAQ0_9GLOM|nr:426_t:CDS:2 [Acaulospora morrowiae]